MLEHHLNLTGRLKKDLNAVLIAGFLGLGLAGCGGGSQPPPPTPSLSQIVSISHPNPRDTCIDYNATVENVSQATREIKYNGSVVDTKTISESQSPYNESFCDSDAKQGDYIFTLSASGATTDTDTVTIENFDPVADFIPLDTDLGDKYEGSEKTYDLGEHITDQNSENNPVPVISAESLDGKIQTILNGSNLTTKVIQGALGAYQVKVMYGSEEGGRGEKIIEGIINEVPWQVAFRRLVEESPNVFAQDILVMRMDSQGNRVSELTNLTNTHGQSQNLFPYFSPDGEQLTFTSNRDTKLRIYKMNADGGDVQRISPLNLDTALYPVWCSDEEIRFNYYDTQTNTQGIGSIKSDGTGFRKITEDAFVGMFSGRSACSPDSSKLVYVGGDSELYIANSDGSNPLRLTDNAFEDYGPEFAPDGRIYFTRSDSAGGSDIMRINPDGTGLERFTFDQGREFDIAWTPDGSKALFVKGDYHIYSIDPNASNEKQLTTSGIVNRYPNVRPWLNQ